MQVHAALRAHNCKHHWPADQISMCPWVRVCKNQGFRGVDNFFLARYQQVVARSRESWRRVSSCLHSLRVPLQPVPQGEAPGHGSEPFSQANGGSFNLLSVQYPGVGASQNCLSDGYNLGAGPTNANPSGHKGRAIKGHPCRDCAHSRALVIQVKITGGRAHPCL